MTGRVVGKGGWVYPKEWPAAVSTGGEFYSSTQSSGNDPLNQVAPVASGTPDVGQTLSVTNGTWSGDAVITFTYQWQRNGSNIGSATNNTYLLVSADAETSVRCVVTGTNSSGSNEANSNAIDINAEAGGGSYFVLEEDGTSKFILEEGTFFLILE